MSKKNKKLKKPSKSTKKTVSGNPSFGQTAKIEYDVLKIQWDDHFSGNVRWGDISEVRTKPLVNMSVGFKIKEDKKTITLAQSMGENLTVSDTVTIIKNCITKQEKLGTIYYDKA